MKKVALVGGNGYIGRSLYSMLAFRDDVEVVPVSREELWSESLDAISKEADVLVNCAGYVGKPNVDASQNPNVWTALVTANAHLPKRLRTYAENHDCELVHISSGCIFQGIMSQSGFPALELNHGESWWKHGWEESRTPNFSGSKYAESKILGEVALGEMEKAYILRPRMPFCGNTTTKNLLMKLKNYRVIVDAWNSVTSVREFCNSICGVIPKPIRYGTYNLCHNIPVRNTDIIGMMVEQGFHDGDFEVVSPESFNAVAEAERSFTILDCRKSILSGIGMTEDPTALLTESIHSMSRSTLSTT